MLLAPTLALLVSVLTACGDPATRDDERAHLPRPGADGITLVVEGLLNGSFEWVADGTTTPPKYGAYWTGAFSFSEGDSGDRIGGGDDAAEGTRWLELAPDEPDLHQKLVADPRWTERTLVHLAWRGAGRLRVTLEDGPGRRVSALAEGGPPDAHGWRRASLPLGAAFFVRYEQPPVPRLLLHLSAEGGPVQVDALSAEVSLPLVRREQAVDVIEGLVRETLVRWIEPPERGGLGLVDPATGYVTTVSFDVQTGADRQPNPIQHIHSLHELLLRWIRHCDATGRREEADRWRPLLETFVRTLLSRHFDPDTGLPRIAHAERGPFHQAPVTVGSFVEFLTDAREVLSDPVLAEAAARQVRRVGDTLLALQRAHDLDPELHPNEWSLDRNSGALVGSFDNWYGHMPNRLTPKGVIDGPRRFNTAWAIVTGRSFWYHLIKSPAAVMAAHEVDPRDGDLPGIERALSRYDRAWDATRYDLENDTDDHYGYLCEDLLELLRHSDGTITDALALVQQATDHRLARDTGRVDDTLWIQAVRLGTACAGDSPRAFKGVLDLYELPPEINPVSSGLPLYRDAILELAANDWKGRQLTNAEFTESFFKTWEMVCICFKGTYQGDCRERPLDAWDGDVGDIFGGPPLQGIDAQAVAWRVADASQRLEILARLGTIHHATESGLRREYGYLAGLDPAIARQYGLPPKYATGLDRHSPAGLGYVNAWMGLLPYLAAP